MKTDTAQRLLAYLKTQQEATPKQLSSYLGIGAPALFRQLKKLQQQNTITKIGTPPHVFYTLAVHIPATTNKLPAEQSKIITQGYLTITPSGEILTGVPGFQYWCTKQNLPLEKTAAEYIVTLQKYAAYKTNSLIDGLPKLHDTFSKVYLDELYYLDFYSIERFGKTKLGWLLLQAKQSQNITLIKTIVQLIQEPLQKLLITKNISAVGFIPPTIKRVVQLQKSLEQLLALPLPMITMIKANKHIPVAQKSLSKLADRVENASTTIFIEDTTIQYDTILLIDDAVGSGATLNETAKKIKAHHISTKVIGLAITGSFKGFPVLTDV